MENLTLTLSCSGSADAIARVLAAIANLREAAPAPSPTREAQGFRLAVTETGANSGLVVTLDPDQFREFVEGMDPLYQKGVRLFADKGIVSYDELGKVGIDNPGHFKSRTSVRARNVLGMKRRVQFAPYYYRIEKGGKVWHLGVPEATLASMREYYGLSPQN
ncbi:MAG: hypothetical protein QOJ53_2247 [Sphingomonadales bacterium]|jgi:hypothetical protein|nr:hypothetical protein [Sphingomonadales bacterium]MEA3043128.1 hypothetical protein [Sphingomonadales bacterium]MEA3047915.1 hypothetical protein [Sphingomonadales bacterium]